LQPTGPNIAPNSSEKLRQIILKTTEKSLQTPTGYPELLQDLKSRIQNAQVRAAFAVSGDASIPLARWKS
jgi:hypothetical protein